MRCDLCGEELEGISFQKDGMNFCSLECSDAMETGELMPLGEDILDDPDEYEDDEAEDIEDDEEDQYDDEYKDDEILGIGGYS
jgi:hypothetical protein